MNFYTCAGCPVPEKICEDHEDCVADVWKAATEAKTKKLKNKRKKLTNNQK